MWWKEVQNCVLPVIFTKKETKLCIIIITDKITAFTWRFGSLWKELTEVVQYCTPLSNLSAKSTPLATKSQPICSPGNGRKLPCLYSRSIRRRNRRNPLEVVFLSNTRYTLQLVSEFPGYGSCRSRLLLRMTTPKAISLGAKFLSDLKSTR